MQTSSTPFIGHADCDTHSRHLLNIVIIYEDFAAGTHAKETYDFLINQLGRDFDFNHQMWKFDILENAKMRRFAVTDAAASDLIIVSTHGEGELPPGAKALIDEWAADKGNAMGLVALVDRPRHMFEEDNRIKDFLEEAAHRTNIAFFSQPDDWPGNEEDFSSEQVSERAQQTSLIITDFLHHNSTSSHNRWGINE